VHRVVPASESHNSYMDLYSARPTPTKMTDRGTEL
jgi:hypothetical protein